MSLSDRVKLPSIKELIGIPPPISNQPQVQLQSVQQQPIQNDPYYNYTAVSPSSRNSSTSTGSPHMLPTVQLSPPTIMSSHSRQNSLPNLNLGIQTASYQIPAYHMPQYSFQQQMGQHQMLHQAPIIIHHSPIHQHRHSFSHQIPAGIIPKRKRPRRKANEMVRLYACNYGTCRNSYGTLNHLNAHITFKKHGPKRKPEEFRQIRELYKLKKKLSDSLSNYTPSSNDSQVSSPNDDVTSNEDSAISSRSNSNVDPITSLLISSSSNGQLDEEFIRKNRESIKILTNLSEKLIEEKGEEQLAIFHQQRGYNGYGRYDHTLTSNDLEKLPLK